MTSKVVIAEGRVSDKLPVKDPEFNVADQYSVVLEAEIVAPFVPPASALNDSTVITGLAAAVVASVKG